MKRVCPPLAALTLLLLFGNWGFFGHQRINRLAVFTLPEPMIGFYKANLDYIVTAAVNPDQRRMSVPEEAPRHYIDLDHYGDSAQVTMPRHWHQALEKYSDDTLKAYGILPWHIYKMYASLRQAFLLKDPENILRLSAEIGHYIADAHVPLHTTENYNGQLTGQEGIHAFWESTLPEQFSDDYNFFVGRASYLPYPQQAAWTAIQESHSLVAKVLADEKDLATNMGTRKYAFETRGRQTVKTFSRTYAEAYHKRMQGMVEKRMRDAIKFVGDIWYTAWVDGGQPDLNELIHYTPSPEELAARKAELQQMKEQAADDKGATHH